MEKTRQVSLREISNENLASVLSLDVAESQKKVYPRSNAYSIAEGHYPPDDGPVWILAIYAGDTAVGFLMTSEAPDKGDYFLWRLMIGAQYQSKGYGLRAVELLIDRIKNTPNAKVLTTSHLTGGGDAGSFYRRLGFSYAGELLGNDDHLMEIVF